MPELMKEQWQIDQSNQAVPADSAVSAFFFWFHLDRCWLQCDAEEVLARF